MIFAFYRKNTNMRNTTYVFRYFDLLDLIVIKIFALTNKYL